MKHLAVIPIVLLQVLVNVLGGVGDLFIFLGDCCDDVLRKLLDWRDE